MIEKEDYVDLDEAIWRSSRTYTVCDRCSLSLPQEDATSVQEGEWAGATVCCDCMESLNG